ncbi:MAG: Trm112 family protein [Fimbriimonadales bacterium]
MIDADFLAILACPICEDRPPLRQEGDVLICTKAGHRFPVKDGIPHLMPEDEMTAGEPKETTV